MANPLTWIATRGAGRSLPWVRVYVAGRWLLGKGHAAYTGLAEAERTRLASLVRKSRGRPGNLTKSERQDLGALVRKAATAARRR